MGIGSKRRGWKYQRDLATDITRQIQRASDLAKPLGVHGPFLPTELEHRCSNCVFWSGTMASRGKCKSTGEMMDRFSVRDCYDSKAARNFAIRLMVLSESEVA